MTPTPLDAKPQGAQLKRYDISSYSAMSDAGGKWCKYAEAAERIEKLERENEQLRTECSALMQQSSARVMKIMEVEHERDTALRALAEARRERDESIRAHKDMTHEASRIGMLHLDNHLGDVYHAMQNLRVGYGAKRSGHFVQDAARQPEKDANNG